VTVFVIVTSQLNALPIDSFLSYFPHAIEFSFKTINSIRTQFNKLERITTERQIIKRKKARKKETNQFRGGREGSNKKKTN
jgi:hypothetical protein